MSEIRKKFYKKWTKNEIDYLEKKTGITEIYVEFNEAGEVLREVGLDNQGKIIHKCPSSGYKYGTYGIFDLVKLEPKILNDNLNKETFERLWELTSHT